MKVIFLDVDGVLNTRETWGFERQFPLPLVARLRHLVDTTGAKIVVSSTWRISLMDRLLSNLEVGGVPRETVIDATPFLQPHGLEAVPRGIEIQAWLDSHPEVNTFVILDDGTDMAHLLPRLVQTDHVHGLTDADVDRAIEMLRTEVPHGRGVVLS